MQERACEHLKRACDDLGRSQWGAAPRGPTYTLVLDCQGLRPYHFGRATRRCLTALTHVFTHYYPDFVERTIVVNTPGFLAPIWAVVSSLMPAWWGVRIEKSLGDLERREGLRLTA